MSTYIWKLRFTTWNPDEAGSILLARGCDAVDFSHISEFTFKVETDSIILANDDTLEKVVTTSKGEISCFLEGTEESVLEWARVPLPFGMKLISHEKLEDKNWVQQCKEVLTPLEIRSLTIQPIVDAIEAEIRAPDTIYIIPGLGFGTGHHETTSSVIELFQHESIAKDPPVRSLDLGTGSGVLAIALAHLYKRPVDAVDIDPHALENASENTWINCCSNLVSLTCGSIEKTVGCYDLIVANIYAEVLIELYDEIASRLIPGGKLLLSGIMNTLFLDVRNRYAEPAWKEIATISRGNWTTALFQAS